MGDGTYEKDVDKERLDLFIFYFHLPFEDDL